MTDLKTAPVTIEEIRLWQESTPADYAEWDLETIGDCAEFLNVVMGMVETGNSAYSDLWANSVRELEELLILRVLRDRIRMLHQQWLDLSQEHASAGRITTAVVIAEHANELRRKLEEKP